MSLALPCIRSPAAALRQFASRTRAVLAAEISAIRGDLRAEPIFTGARFMGIDRSTSLDRGPIPDNSLGPEPRGDGGFLDRRAEFHKRIWPPIARRLTRPIFESLVANADPPAAQLLRSGQPKMRAVGRPRRFPGKPVLSSLFYQVLRGSRSSSRREQSREGRAHAKRPSETVPSRQFRNIQGQQR